ncbi:uncharacterized protein N7525_005394 [Penicillium rubens]|uniref:uncharacterized protein n=1 Tax=Penicillium rubens TaxID=1108849 RepID=UPI002A5B0E84|nr:uncharacterized protein N7525_005394 [Penicillium rubens]KAJ5840206.1 hypothetical protein N7525_005394 [Penicillium rubens]
MKLEKISRRRRRKRRPVGGAAYGAYRELASPRREGSPKCSPRPFKKLRRPLERHRPLPKTRTGLLKKLRAPFKITPTLGDLPQLSEEDDFPMPPTPSYLRVPLPPSSLREDHVERGETAGHDPPPPPASNKRPVDTRAAHLAERGLPTNTPSGPSRRGLASSRWGPYTARAPPNAPWAARKAPPAAQHAPGEDDLPMPPAPARKNNGGVTVTMNTEPL